jgi:carbonic anhydrase/acetyltransferase-like protein (isoleucine patch superfamily)
MPGKVKRELSEEEIAGILKNAEVYVNEAKKYKEKGWG